MLDNLYTSLSMITCPPSLVGCSIHCQVEWTVSMVSQAVDVWSAMGEREETSSRLLDRQLQWKIVKLLARTGWLISRL